MICWSSFFNNLDVQKLSMDKRLLHNLCHSGSIKSKWVQWPQVFVTTLIYDNFLQIHHIAILINQTKTENIDLIWSSNRRIFIFIFQRALYAIIWIILFVVIIITDVKNGRMPGETSQSVAQNVSPTGERVTTNVTKKLILPHQVI